MMSRIESSQTDRSLADRVVVIRAGHSGPMQQGKLLTEFTGRQAVPWSV